MTHWLLPATILLLIVAACFIFARYGAIWFQARSNGVPVGFFRLLRTCNARGVVHASILAARGSVEVDFSALQSLADPVEVVMGLIAADAAGLDESLESLSEIQSRGESVLDHVRIRADSK